MYTKFRNRLPNLDTFAALAVFLLLFPFILLVFIFVSIFGVGYDKKFLAEYKNFLNQNEGQKFFCYTNRKNSVKAIEENVLPLLDDSINIVKLVGKKPHTDLDERSIGYALYNLQNIGFPNVMQIINGEMHDVSLHKKMYAAVNENKESELHSIVKEAISGLERAYKT